MNHDMFPWMKYPIEIKINVHIPAPRDVNKQNLNKFIFENPAGSEINCLITGINLPINVVISPCFLK